MVVLRDGSIVHGHAFPPFFFMSPNTSLAQADLGPEGLGLSLTRGRPGVITKVLGLPKLAAHALAACHSGPKSSFSGTCLSSGGRC